MTAPTPIPAATPSTPFTTFERAAALLPGFVRHGVHDVSARPLQRMPLVPAESLKAHSCFIATDTRFRSAARLLQSLWRQDQNLPIGLHHSLGDKPSVIKLGSRLDPVAARAGRNFISPAVHSFVRHQLVMREEGACIDEDRLYANLLSSMPLTFNLLAPWPSISTSPRAFSNRCCPPSFTPSGPSPSNTRPVAATRPISMTAQPSTPPSTSSRPTAR